MTATNTVRKRNFRFWEYLNDGWVKLTLRPGQTLKWETWGRDEEGYSHTVETWELNDDGSRCDCRSMFDGRDCDGRISRHWQGTFDVTAGEYVPAYEGMHNGQPILRPKFTETKTSQRDYTAEAAGY